MLLEFLLNQPGTSLNIQYPIPYLHQSDRWAYTDLSSIFIEGSDNTLASRVYLVVPDGSGKTTRYPSVYHLFVGVDVQQGLDASVSTLTLFPEGL